MSKKKRQRRPARGGVGGRGSPKQHRRANRTGTSDSRQYANPENLLDTTLVANLGLLREAPGPASKREDWRKDYDDRYESHPGRVYRLRSAFPGEFPPETFGPVSRVMVRQDELGHRLKCYCDWRPPRGDEATQTHQEDVQGAGADQTHTGSSRDRASDPGGRDGVVPREAAGSGRAFVLGISKDPVLACLWVEYMACLQEGLRGVTARRFVDAVERMPSFDVRGRAVRPI